MEEQRSSSANNERGDAPPPKKEIYTHSADWTIYGMGWSQREEEDRGFRLALGSFGEKNKKLQLLITVSDNGPGVSKNIVADIFDPFSTTKIGGSGLGLPLVAKIISEHGGFVELDDASEGACFKIYLPAYNISLSERIH